VSLLHHHRKPAGLRSDDVRQPQVWQPLPAQRNQATKPGGGRFKGMLLLHLAGRTIDELPLFCSAERSRASYQEPGSVIDLTRFGSLVSIFRCRSTWSSFFCFFRFLCGSFMAVGAVPGAVSCDGLSPSFAVDPPWWPSLRRAQQRSRMARSATEGSSLRAASTTEYLGPARD